MNAPNVSFGFGGTMALGIIALAAGVGLFVYTKRKEIVAAVNPLSDQNLAYQGANAVASTIAGRDETLGGWLHDLFSSKDDEIAEMLKVKQAPQQTHALSATSGAWVNDGPGLLDFATAFEREKQAADESHKARYGMSIYDGAVNPADRDKEFEAARQRALQATGALGP